MKILILSNCPLDRYQGSGYVIVNTAEKLTKLGHKIELIPPHFFSFLPFLKSKANVYRMAFGMAKWICVNRKSLPSFQLIIFYGAESFLSIFMLKSILKVSTPIILHSNGLELHVEYRLHSFNKLLGNNKRWYNFKNSWLFRYSYNSVNAIITVSKYDRDFAIQHLKIASNKIFYLEPSLPDIFFNSNAKKALPKKCLITYCGSWIRRKGIESIKGSIPYILRKYPEYKFRIIGCGVAFNPNDHFPEDVIEQIEIFPFVEKRDELIQLYSESLIFLFPSFCESFGLVVAEAMSCCCAVITGPTGFAADLKNYEEAIILRLPDPLNVQRAIESLINDPLLRDKLSINGNKRVGLLQCQFYGIHLNFILKNVLQSYDSIKFGTV